MSSVPAWKRAGLSVKAQQQQEDEDSLTTKRIENADLTVKEIKKSVIKENFKTTPNINPKSHQNVSNYLRMKDHHRQ